MSDLRKLLMFCQNCGVKLHGPRPHPFDEDNKKMGVFQCGACGYTRVLYRSQGGASGWQSIPQRTDDRAQLIKRITERKES